MAGTVNRVGAVVRMQYIAVAVAALYLQPSAGAQAQPAVRYSAPPTPQDRREYHRVQMLVAGSADGGGVPRIRWQNARKAFLIEIRDDFAFAYSVPRSGTLEGPTSGLMITTVRKRANQWKIIHCGSCYGNPPTKQQLLSWGASRATAERLTANFRRYFIFTHRSVLQ